MDPFLKQLIMVGVAAACVIASEKLGLDGLDVVLAWAIGWLTQHPKDAMAERRRKSAPPVEGE